MSRQEIEEGRLWESLLNHKESSMYDCSTVGSESIVKPLSEWMHDRELRRSNDNEQRPDELKSEGNRSLESSYEPMMNSSTKTIFSFMECDNPTSQQSYECSTHMSQVKGNLIAQPSASRLPEFLKTMIKIKKHGTNYFKGGRSTFAADSWLKNLKKNCLVTRCPEEYNKDIAIYYLKKDSANWWTNLEKQFEDKDPT